MTRRCRRCNSNGFAAQQDYEYLYLARQRGEAINALFMSRLMTKPVEIQPDQSPDPTLRPDVRHRRSNKRGNRRSICSQKAILLREPGQPIDKAKRYQLNIQTLQWSRAAGTTRLMGRATKWLGFTSNGRKWIALQLGVDIYNHPIPRQMKTRCNGRPSPNPAGRCVRSRGDSSARRHITCGDCAWTRSSIRRNAQKRSPPDRNYFHQRLHKKKVETADGFPDRANRSARGTVKYRRHAQRLDAG